MPDHADAEDGLAGVEIDFSFDVEGDGLQQSTASDGLPENPTPRPTHTTGGQLHGKSIDIRLKRAQTDYLSLACSVDAVAWTCRSSKTFHQS